jgi:hypothetical protein
LSIVISLRSRRLETLFGSNLDSLTAAHVRGLVDARVSEAFDLDFKSALYGRSDRDKQKLAVDVAAMANTAGGVIVLGIDEDDQACAAATATVEVSEAERGRIQQVVAALVAPMPTFDVEIIYDDRDEANSVTSGDTDSDSKRDVRPSRGFIMIAILRSRGAPHAVLVNQALRYPKRNGATTRYLSEPEVAAAYSDRAAGAARQASRIAQVEQEAFQRLDREQDSWVVVTLMPDVAGDFSITAASFEEFRRTGIGRAAIVPVHVGLHRVRVGRQRFLADGTSGSSPLARYASLELHTDGAGAYGLKLGDFTAATTWRADPNQPSEHRIVADEGIAVAVVSGLMRLAQHARDRTAASGNAVVRATLLPATAADSIAIGHDRRGFTDSRSSVSAYQELVTSEAVAPLDDLASPAAPLVAAAATLIDQIGQAFGIPEMGQFGSDGSVRVRYWHPRDWQQGIVAWAERHNIVVSDDTLEE